MRVVLAEKPSVAKDIARVLGADKKGDGFLEGNGWCVTWAYGHLVQLADPAAYDENYSKWSIESLPILPDKFIYNVSGDSSAKRQFKVISRLFSEADDIVCATDAGREGEAIFRYIYNMSKCTKPFKRLWISSLTDKAIKDGFAALRPGGEYDNLYLSAKARNEADWIVGLNATRALTLASQSRQPLSLGRVQTPTLSLVCRRFIENRDFKPKTFYTVDAVLEGGGRKFTAHYPVRFDTKEAAAGLTGRVGGTMSVKERRKEHRKEKAPLPFDITSLQAEANKRYGFKAQKTLDIVQSLYETHKMLTYPRTGSRYLGDDMQPEIVKSISALRKLDMPSAFKEAVYALEKDGINTECFNSAKLTDHHAIIPTFQNLDKESELKEDERKIFRLAATQLVLALMQPCEKDCLYYSFDAGVEELFTSGGYKVSIPGWRMLYDDKSEEEDEENQMLPELSVGDIVKVVSCGEKEGQTKRPALLTEATLLKAMETAGKQVEDAELADAMKDCGLGTPATRAAIIETLYKRGYMISEKNKIKPTELGLRVYALTKDFEIGSAALTGEWERKLNLIAEGGFGCAEFMAGITDYTKKEVARILQSGAACKVDELAGLRCPECGKPLVQNSKAYGCSGYAEDGCHFVVWKTMAGKAVTPEHLREICEKGQTSLIKGFKSKEGKTFDASLKWDSEKAKVAYLFPERKTEVIGKCPVCGADIVEAEKGYHCHGEGCDFVIWKTVAGKKISSSVAKELLSKGVTGVVKGFKSKEGKNFDASLRLQDGRVVFDFPKRK